ncbi:unnamed protein product [Clavelina lepadiformis]|uniref:Vesicle-fusing ATPase n=1 Tax=Clavelina lepadiformis TaxID=159417 RepID=A0ABP0FMR4_CLALP
MNPLNNMLIIGMTNRHDMIDEALLRPGRLEVHLEIDLPDEVGRLQILSIHTHKMKDSQMLSDDVDLGKIAELTENFTGAELAGLVRAALSRALVRHKDQLQARSDVEADHKILVCFQDFKESLENDTKPAFGFQRENLKYFMSHGIIEWNNGITRILEKSAVICDQVRSSNRTPLVSVLITGGVGSGKTALATKIADDSGFPFIRVCTPDNLIGSSEAEKCQYFKKDEKRNERSFVLCITQTKTYRFFDSYKSPLSCVVVDDIERLIDYNPHGSKFSNLVAQALMILCKKRPPLGHRLLVIATSSNDDLLSKMDIEKSFDSHIKIPLLNAEAINTVLEEMKAFTPEDRSRISENLQKRKISISIKSLIRIVAAAEQEEPEMRHSSFISLLVDEARLK